MNSKNTWIVMLLACCLSITPQTASIAQPSLNFQAMSINWPTVTLITQVKCDSLFRTALATKNFMITENGVEIRDFTVSYLDTNSHCCMSVALVFDRSGSMGWGTPTGIEGAKQGGKAFVDMLDGVCDEATIISFNTMVTVDVYMTGDKVALKNSIDSLRANGGETVWEAGAIGIRELLINSTQECKAMILLEDGDTITGETPDDIIALALPNKIRVFMIGLGTGINDADLSRVANETGGKYYKVPKPEGLVEVYKEIYRTIRNGFYQSEITYNSKCQDGSKRNVNLTVQNLSDCLGTDKKTKSFRARRDTSTFTPISIEVSQSFANQNSYVEIPILLQTPINDIFQPASFRITFDTTCLQFAGCYMDKTLLDGVGINVTSIPRGVEIKTLQPKMINDSGVLAKLVFRTYSRGDSSYRQCPVTLSDWKFQAGCFKGILNSGEVILDVLPSEKIVNDFMLYQNYPNPFSESTTINLPLLLGEGRGEVLFKVYDIFGREVLDLSNQLIDNSKLTIYNFQLPSAGLYFYRLSTPTFSQTRAMLLMQ